MLTCVASLSLCPRLKKTQQPPPAGQQPAEKPSPPARPPPPSFTPQAAPSASTSAPPSGPPTNNPPPMAPPTQAQGPPYPTYQGYPGWVSPHSNLKSGKQSDLRFFGPPAAPHNISVTFSCLYSSSIITSQQNQTCFLPAAHPHRNLEKKGSSNRKQPKHEVGKL